MYVYMWRKEIFKVKITYRSTNPFQMVEEIFRWIALKKREWLQLSQSTPERMSISTLPNDGQSANDVFECLSTVEQKLKLLWQVTMMEVHKRLLFRLSLQNNWACEAKNKDSQIRCDMVVSLWYHYESVNQLYHFIAPRQCLQASPSRIM